MPCFPGNMSVLLAWISMTVKFLRDLKESNLIVTLDHNYQKKSLSLSYNCKISTEISFTKLLRQNIFISNTQISFSHLFFLGSVLTSRLPRTCDTCVGSCSSTLTLFSCFFHTSALQHLYCVQDQETLVDVSGSFSTHVITEHKTGNSPTISFEMKAVCTCDILMYAII